MIRAEAPAPLKIKPNQSKSIMNYGVKNLYPQEVVEIVNKSAYGSSCQKTFANYLFGEGLEADKESPFAKKALEYFFPHDLMQKICYDYSLFGGYCLQARPNTQSKIAKINHVDFSIARLGIYNADFRIDKAYLSANWAESNKPENKPVPIDLYDKIKMHATVEEFKAKGSVPEEFNGQLVYVKQYKAGEPFYPTPIWSGALNWVYIDGAISVFQSKNLDNGFFPSTIIFHPGKFDGKTADGRDKKDAINERLAEFTSPENAGKIFNTFGSSLIDAPQVIQFTANTNSELFSTLGDITDKKIVAGFQQPKILAGIETTGSLGASNEIANAIELYYSIIQPHIVFLENEINRLLADCEGYDGTKVKLKKSKPISYLDDKFLNYLDESEIRKAAGFPEKRPSAIQQNGGTI